MSRGDALWLVLLCGCQPRYDRCDAQPHAAQEALGAELTIEETEPSASQHTFTPAHALWSDGADKRRWFSLPPGAVIDTSEVDDWIFPRGSVFYKEFSSAGARLEIRVLRKVGDADDAWAAMAYVWDGARAVAAPDGAMVGAHVVPSAAQCAGCHGGRRSHVLGFSAVQLQGTQLDQYQHLFSRPVPRVTVPGNDSERGALGYLHANCSHCHNSERPARSGARCYDPQNALDFFVRASDRTAGETATYRSALDPWIEPGEPDESALLRRFRRQDEPAMPPLGVTVMDPSGEHILSEWIRQLPR